MILHARHTSEPPFRIFLILESDFDSHIIELGHGNVLTVNGKKRKRGNISEDSVLNKSSGTETIVSTLARTSSLLARLYRSHPVSIILLHCFHFLSYHLLVYCYVVLLSFSYDVHTCCALPFRLPRYPMSSALWDLTVNKIWGFIRR